MDKTGWICALSFLEKDTFRCHFPTSLDKEPGYDYFDHMKSTPNPTLFSLAAAVPAFFTVSVGLLSAGTDYHIRPYVGLVEGPIDGIQENSATSGTEQFFDATREGYSSVDLGTGTLETLSAIDTSVLGGSASVVGLAEFSETFTIRNAAGTSFGLGFDFDAVIEADAHSVMGDPAPYTLFFTANLAVFEPGVADWDTWFDLATNTDDELFFDTFTETYSKPDMDIDDSIGDSLSFDAVLPDNDESFHVFSRIQIGTLANTPQTAFIDASNTGVLDFSADPSATVYSASGVFPGTLPIPEPSGMVFVMLGAASLGIRRLR